MAVTHAVGFNGTITGVGAQAVVSWELTKEVDQLETTNMIESPGSGGSKAFYPGLKSWSGTVECVGDNDPGGTPVVAGTAYTIVLNDGTSDVLDGAAEGKSLVTSVRVSVATAEMIAFSFDIVGPVDDSL